MEFTVAIYERRDPHSHHWWTLGLGARNCHRSGRHAGKLRDQLLGDLRGSLAKAKPAELERFQLPSGIELRHERLELRLGRGRRHTGRFPIILAPHPTTAADRLVTAYHPLRQDAWFPFDADRTLAEQAALFFQREWRHLDEEDLELLAAAKRERLRIVSLNAHPKTLLDELPKNEEKALAVGGGGVRRRRGRLSVLPEVAVDETRSIVDEPPTSRPRAAWLDRLARQAGGGSPLVVVGEPGVGKSTLIRQWAAGLLQDDGYGAHGNLDRCRHVWRVAGRRLIAGMSYVGQWEERALGLVEEAMTHRVVLWIEDLHAFGHLGRTVESDRCLADVFRSAVARREIHLIGELTPSQLRILEDDVPAFAALFTRLLVEKPSIEETLGLLVHEARGLEVEHGVAFHPALFRTLLETSESLLSTSALPGKALELLRGLAREWAGRDEWGYPIGTGFLLKLLARRTGIPEVLLDPAFPIEAREVEESLQHSVVGQEAGVAAARDTILRMKTGLADPRRPYGVLLFTGPTGTGKTELAKALAAYLYGGASRLVRFDMSEYSGPDAAARLIGERGRPRGRLTTAVREQPFSVVLFDEIEKCHPSVLHLLLQVAGDGRLTDAAGDVADFTHTVVVLTSNLGASGRSRLGFEGGSADALTQEFLAAVKAHFPPELFNRIDRVVPFRPLDPEVARVIGRRELERLLGRRGLVERGIFVTATERVLDRVVAEGFNAEEGARSLKRYLDRRIGGPLAELIAGSAGAEMRRVSVHAASEGFGLYSEELREARPAAETSPLEPFLTRSVDNLRAELKPALELVESLARGAQLAELSERLRAHLSDYRIGKTGLADRIYNLDALRGRLTELAEQLSRQIEAAEPELGEQIELERFAVLSFHGPSLEYGRSRFRVLDRRALSDASLLADRAELLALLGEVHFLRRVLSRVEDMSRHAVFVELAHVGQAARDRFATRRDGVLEWLAGFYAWTRGELEGWAVSYEDGKRRDGVDHGGLTDALGRGARRVVLKLAGLSVLDRFTGEHGCHLRTSLGGTTEIVRVAVSPAPPDVTAEAALAASEEARRRFVDALESGSVPLPENPEQLLPVIRRYDYEPAEDAASRCEVEDYLLSHASAHHVRYFFEVLTVLSLLHQTVEAP